MADHPVKRRKKMIEVAIPLEAINAAAAAEKQPGIGAHPRGLHLWWARRPLAAARAVIFCQMVDDPSAVPEEFPTAEAQENERLRLFALISEFVQWKNSTNEEVLKRARYEIDSTWRRCCKDNSDHPEAEALFNPENPPGFHDPFAGGGALPLEAQRLGLEAHASDLNPVAVMINKGMIEIPPKFSDMPPVNPEARNKKQLIANKWSGTEGLAEDVRYYGDWMKVEAEKRIGHLYPKVEVTAEMAEERTDLKPYVGQRLNVIAWIWVRTAKSPNPAFSHVDVPLASTFMLSAKPGKEAYVEPIIDGEDYRFTVKLGKPHDSESFRQGTKAEGRGANFRCLMSQTPISGDYLKAEGMAGRIGTRMMAIVAEGSRGRLYLPPTNEHSAAAKCDQDPYISELALPKESKGRTAYWCKLYGLTTYSKLFTQRQLVALTTFSDLVQEAREHAKADALVAGLIDDGISLCDGGSGATALSDAISVYLSFAINRLADYNSSIATWKPSGEQVMQTFKRQALPMTWDFPESNVLGSSAICWSNCIKYTYQNLSCIASTTRNGFSFQSDAQAQGRTPPRVISSDPPYYDNIGYADLSDFFYIWMRRSLRFVFPKLFATLAVPKAEELVAIPYRHGGKEKAESFFLSGMTLAMKTIAENSHKAYPVTIYYAFKQAETKSASGLASTGWETFLAAVIEAGFALHGTWPMRTELANRMIGSGTNALASSVVLVCQRRLETALTLSRTDFRRLLRVELPKALKELERANIAPVDVAQAAIGPGMAIFSSAKAVLNPDDSPMSVREALIEINTALDEYLSQDEGDLDADSRFALTFFESYGYEERPYGDAEGLAIARNLSVDGVAEAGILSSVAGKVRLYQRTQLPDDWDPTTDRRLCVWEATQHLIKRLEARGEGGAAELLLQLKNISGHGDLAANCRALAYRLYNHCEKKKQAEEARAYNGLVIAWPELERLASASSNSSSAPRQTTLI
jgi:putative DNA methylase